MSATAADRSAPPEPIAVGVAAKGLRRGAIGFAGSTILGVVQTAPAYSIAVTMGLLAATVGLQAPALLILAFVPILCMTIVEREFVVREPDCGTVFVWVGRAFGPYAGWIASWALLAATFIALANLANVAGIYFFLFVGAEASAASEAATVAVGIVCLALAVWLAVRGIHVSARVQAWLLGAGMAVLVVFAAVALVKIVAGTAGTQAPDVSLSWFDPFAVGGTSALSAGLLLAIFFYWGWDGSAAVVEEADGGSATPRRALIWSAVMLLGFYLVLTFALQGYAGVGDTGIGLAGEAASGDALSVVGGAAVGSWFETLMELAVMVSAAACLIAAVLPTARSLLSMGAYRAVPSAFARVAPRTGSPVVSTVAVGAAVAGVLVVLSIVSNNVLGDAIGAIVLLIAFYYTLVGLAALWTFRGEVLRSRSDFLRKGLAPLVGTAVLGWALVRNGRDTLDEDYGLTTLLGVGGVFVIGVATLLAGLLLMAAWNLRSPAFFRGETFAPGYLERHDPDLLREVREV
jgi:amino acid transporter